MNFIKTIKISRKAIAVNLPLMMGALSLFAVNFAVNVDQAQSQTFTTNRSSQALSPAHQMLLDAQQSNAPAVGGGSMQLLRFSQNSLSFAPLEGIDRFLRWEITEGATAPQATFKDCIDKFKQEQRERIGAVSKMQEAINQL
ncbi:MAG: hypothetical protein NW214_00510 [Pseudanabaenaceae cyanobacterium bins.39]|nr:hypothetical protein [Pseudanabaenaceae cyanobacterium bins.39]